MDISQTIHDIHKSFDKKGYAKIENFIDDNIFTDIRNFLKKECQKHNNNFSFDNSNKIDHLIDSNKYLLTKIFNYNKWLFTGLKIYDGKFKNFWNCKNIKIKFSNSISNIFVKTILLINDVEVGEIFQFEYEI